MFTCVAFSKTADVANDVFTLMTPVADQSFPQNQSSQFQPPFNGRIIASLQRGLHGTGYQLDSPQLRQTFLPELYPSILSATIPANNSFDYDLDGGVLLRAGEGFSARSSVDATGLTREQVVLWIQDSLTPAPPGQSFLMRCTVNSAGSITTGASAWTFGTLVFSQQLPAGTWSVVGMQVSASEGSCARLVFTANGYMRPGCIPQAAYGNTYAPQVFRAGRLGEWGRFVTTSTPNIEILGFAGATESPIVFLDLIKVSDSLGFRPGSPSGMLPV